MVEEQTEMSLDEVLSSIKRMIVDKDPPVLELTDMVSGDGSIVKVKHGQKDPKDKGELRDFLRLAQENGKDSNPVRRVVQDAAQNAEVADVTAVESDFSSNSSNADFESDYVADEENRGLPRQVSDKNPAVSEKTRITVNEMVREITASLIRDWLDENLPSIAKEIITAEIREMIKKN